MKRSSDESLSCASFGSVPLTSQDRGKGEHGMRKGRRMRVQANKRTRAKTGAKFESADNYNGGNTGFIRSAGEERMLDDDQERVEDAERRRDAGRDWMAKTRRRIPARHRNGISEAFSGITGKKDCELRLPCSAPDP